MTDTIAAPGGVPAGDTGLFVAPAVAVPYLGPEPRSSRGLARWVVGLAVLGATLRLLNVFGSALLAQTDDSDGFYNVDAAEWALEAVNAATLLTGVVTAVVWLRWSARRRPRAVLEAKGEAYVELPLERVMPGGLRLAAAAMAAGALVAGGGLVFSTSADSYAEWVDAWQRQALAGLCWTGVWVVLATVPIVSDRAHRHRLAESAAARAHPEAVPVVRSLPPSPSDLGRPEGVGWVVRTAGLLVVGVLATAMLARSVAVVVNEPLPGLVTVAAFGAVDGLVVRAFVRRRARRAAQSTLGTNT